MKVWKTHRARRQLQRVSVLGASAGLAFMTTGCTAPHPTLAELRQAPEISMLPAGAVMVQRGGVESDRKNIGGVNPAILNDLYATNDDPAAVFAFYRDHLGHEWVEDPNAGVRRTEWADADAWESAHYLFQVGIVNADYRHRAAAALPRARGKRTLFALSLQAQN
jgi:hypothetical protein